MSNSSTNTRKIHSNALGRSLLWRTDGPADSDYLEFASYTVHVYPSGNWTISHSGKVLFIYDDVPECPESMEGLAPEGYFPEGWAHEAALVTPSLTPEWSLADFILEGEAADAEMAAMAEEIPLCERDNSF